MRVPAALSALALAAAGCSAAPAETAIDVSVSRCGQGWSHPHTGQQTLQIRNTGNASAEAFLIETRSGQVYGELENLSPGTTRAMTVDLGGGSFALRCSVEDADPITGPVSKISGPAKTGIGLVPVTTADLYGPVKEYEKYVGGRLPVLVSKTDALTSAVDSGDLSAARAAWLPAHLEYERLGAAYGAFGDFDGEINGSPAGLPKDVADPDFTGFHRVEYGLWHGEPAASLRRPADRLAADVKALRADFPKEQVDPLDLGLRAHEILEGTLRFELSGGTDEGSGSSLATASANIAGTRAVLDTLRPVLAARFPGLADAEARLARLDTLLKAHSGTPVGRLAQTDREKIDAATGDVLERLAKVAAICAPRRTS
jgi:iron uptake system component EfeO